MRHSKDKGQGNLPQEVKSMMFKVFYQLPMGGNYYENVEAISPRNAMKQIMDAHKNVNIVSVFDADGNLLWKGKRL